MKLSQKLMCSAVALGMLLGASESYAVLDDYQARLKKQLESRGLGLADEDIVVLGVMYSKFVPLLVDKWKEAQAAGMSNALIRATIGTNKNQFALDVLTAEIAKRKGTTAGTVSAPVALPEKSSSTLSSSSTLVTTSKNADKNEKPLAQESPKAQASSTNSQSASAASSSSSSPHSTLSQVATAEMIRSALGLPDLTLDQLSLDTAYLRGMNPSERDPILQKMREQVDAGRAAGFTVKQLTDLWRKGFVYSKWQTYVKLPGKNPTKFYDVMMKENRASALAFFGLDEAKATNAEGRQVAQTIKNSLEGLSQSDRVTDWNSALESWTKDWENMLVDTAPSQSVSLSSASSATQNPSISGELTEEKMREAIGLPTINLGILTADVADFKRMLKVEMITRKNIEEILGKMRTELDDARAAGFTDRQLNDLMKYGIIYSNWRTYIKLPGKTPAKFYEATLKEGKFAALAFFGLDEEKATISEGKQAVSAYRFQKDSVGFQRNRYWEEKVRFWLNGKGKDLGAN